MQIIIDTQMWCYRTA